MNGFKLILMDGRCEYMDICRRCLDEIKNRCGLKKKEKGKKKLVWFSKLM